MRDYSLTHLSDGALTSALRANVGTERAATALLLAHIAEFDARQLYRQAAHPSMHSYCVSELRFSESAAYRRIHAARAARDFPALFEAVVEGRLNLTTIVTLAPHLRPWNFDELTSAATHKTRTETEAILAERFPKPDMPDRVEALASPGSSNEAATEASPGVGEPQLELTDAVASASTPTAQSSELALARVGMTTDEQVAQSQSRPQSSTTDGETGSQQSSVDAHADPNAAAPSNTAPTPTNKPTQRVTPLSPKRFGLQFTVDERVHTKLEHAKALLGHRPQGGELAHVFELALDLLIAQLERQKFAATEKPRRGRGSKSARHVSADVKRKVWARDGGQCTFKSDSGKRCPERKGLEYDHVDGVARGGRATLSTTRLRCRAHNQLAAERMYGTEFMRHKREQAKLARAVAKKAAS